MKLSKAVLAHVYHPRINCFTASGLTKNGHRIAGFFPEYPSINFCHVLEFDESKRLSFDPRVSFEENLTTKNDQFLTLNYASAELYAFGLALEKIRSLNKYFLANFYTTYEYGYNIATFLARKWLRSGFVQADGDVIKHEALIRKLVLEIVTFRGEQRHFLLKNAALDWRQQVAYNIAWDRNTNTNVTTSFLPKDALKILEKEDPLFPRTHDSSPDLKRYLEEFKLEKI